MLSQDILQTNQIKLAMGESDLITQFHILPETDSTNRYLKKLASEGAIAGTVVIADRQSAGRGRLGRSFYSPEGSGIYMSILLKPKTEVQKTVRITSMAAVAVAVAIEQCCNIPTQIKWVNDVFLNNRKVCGILTESVFCPDGTLDYVILGIGVNVGKMSFPDEIKSIATSICNECNHHITRNEVIGAILKELTFWYPSIADGSFLNESKNRSILLGKEILVLSGNSNPYSARAVDLDDMGHLWIESDGQRQLLNSGEVSIKF